VTTEREARLVREISDATHIQVVPNGVDTEYFQPPIHPPDPSAPAIVFTGDMSYFPNQEAVVYFAQRVLPLIQRSSSKARFLVVGRNPAPKVQGLRRIEGVEVTGFVPDIRAYLTTSTVAVAPFSIAAGIQNKILEAMACGLPVVATPRAVQGLTSGVAELVGTGNTPEELAERVLEVINNKQLAQEKGMEGRCRVMADYSWGRSADYLLQLLENPLSEVKTRAAVPSPLS
jgi:glycosyltransferase involved in cell wall biosynthesis